MHSSKRGQSSSTKPLRKDSPNWVRYKKEELIQLIMKLAKEGNTPAKTGLILRDQYGVPDVKKIIGESLNIIMEKNGIKTELPYDMLDLLKRAAKVHTHMENNKHDFHSKRGLKEIESKILRLAKYYKAKGRIPKDWRFDVERAKLLIQ